MALERALILDRLSKVDVPSGGDLISRDWVRALQIEGDSVRFVIEAASADEARTFEQPDSV